MRTATDWINELEDGVSVSRDIGNPFFALLVVGFQSTPPTFIRHSDPNRLEQLQKALESGGMPMGFVWACTIEDTPKSLNFRIRPIVDSPEPSWTRAFTTIVLYEVADLMNSDLGRDRYLNPMQKETEKKDEKSS